MIGPIITRPTDEIIELLQLYLVEAAMVEIGGEVRVFGEKPDTQLCLVHGNIHRCL